MSQVQCLCGDIVPVRRDRYIDSWVVGDHGCEHDGNQFNDNQLVPENPPMPCKTCFSVNPTLHLATHPWGEGRKCPDPFHGTADPMRSSTWERDANSNTVVPPFSASDFVKS